MIGIAHRVIGDSTRRSTILALMFALAVLLPARTVLAADVWTPQPANANYGLNGIAFSDTSHGWAVGNDSTIICTTNGGVTWGVQKGPMPSPITLHSVAFANASDGWAVGEAGTIISTTNGGRTWSYQGKGVTAFDLYGVAFADASNGCAVGDSGIVLTTTNGGTTWTVQSLPSGDEDDSLQSVACVNSAYFYAAGDDGKIFVTPNSGVLWFVQNSSTTKQLRGISAYPGDNVFGPHLWAVGDDGTIVATTNGAAWQAQASGTSMPLDSVAFANSNDGWAVGTWGTILKTTDGGAHWAPENSWSKTRELGGVCALDATHAWASDSDSVLACNGPKAAYGTTTKLSAPSSVKATNTLKLVGSVSPSVALGTVKITKAHLVGKKYKSAGSAIVNVLNGAFVYSFKPTKGSWQLYATYTGKVIGAATFKSSKSAVKTVKVK